MPVLIADDVMQTIIEVGLEAKGTKLSFAFVVNTFLLRRLSLICHLRRSETMEQLPVKVWIDGS
jgi:hypothetical protein